MRVYIMNDPHPKVPEKDEVILFIAILAVCLIARIPVANDEKLFEMLISDMNVSVIYWYLLSKIAVGIGMVTITVGIISFFHLNHLLTLRNSRYRYLLFVFIFIWLASNIKEKIGEQVMGLKNGIQAIGIDQERSEIKFRVDSTGVMHGKARFAITNFGNDTVICRIILYKENFGFDDVEFSISDIVLPDSTSNYYNEKIIIYPSKDFIYHINYNTKLTRYSSELYGKINIDKLALISKGEKEIINYK